MSNPIKTTESDSASQLPQTETAPVDPTILGIGQQQSHNLQNPPRPQEAATVSLPLAETQNTRINIESVKNLKPKDWVNNSLSYIKNTFRRFSDNYEAVIGVDITPHYVHICEMRRNDGKWELSDLASSKVSHKSKISDIHGDPDAYIDVLKNLIKESKLHTNRAAIALPTSNAIVRIVTIPIMEESQLQEAIDFGNFWQNLVQIEDLENYSIFKQIIKRDIPRNTMDILFVAAKLSDIEIFSQIVKKAGLQPTIVDVSCFALLNAIRINDEESAENKYQEEEKKAPTAYLQFGPDENYLIIQDGYEPFLYDIYVSDQERKNIMKSGNEPNDDVLKFLKRYATQAKQLVTNHETSYQTHHISKLQVVSSLPFVDNLVADLSRSLDGYEVQKCDFFDHIDVPKKLSDKINSVKNPSSWAVSLGLAVHHLDVFGYYDDKESEDKINLLPGRDRFVRLERYMIEANVALAATTIIAFLAILISFITTSFEESNLDTKLASLSNVQNEYKEKMQHSADLNKKYKKLLELDVIMKDIPANQKPILATNRYITKIIPDGAWLTTISFSQPATMVLKGKSVNDNRILKFINALNDNSDFTKVSLQTVQKIKEKLKSGKSKTLKSFVINLAFDPEGMHGSLYKQNKSTE